MLAPKGMYWHGFQHLFSCIHLTTLLWATGAVQVKALADAIATLIPSQATSG